VFWNIYSEHFPSVRGRERPFGRPPAQIPAGAINAQGFFSQNERKTQRLSLTHMDKPAWHTRPNTVPGMCQARPCSPPVAPFLCGLCLLFGFVRPLPQYYGSIRLLQIVRRDYVLASPASMRASLKEIWRSRRSQQQNVRHARGADVAESRKRLAMTPPRTWPSA
jgi:hypothetical protein